MSKKKKTILGLVLILLLALAIPFTGVLVQKTQNLLTKAFETKANLVINSQNKIGIFPGSWRAIAQGGEESTPYTLTPVVNELSKLSLRYIRIDHLYDFYEITKKEADGSLSFDFSSLDVVIRDIQKTGALPFFSLSYMPSNFSKDGNITNVPNNWEDWKLLVQKTIEHYSGRNGFNLEGVYYEVWNEPDLFGRFEIGKGSKDYLTLYAYAAKGAQSAQNTNKFYFGGPATTGFYPAWMQTLLSYCQKNNLPLDFLSWHYYGKDVNKIGRDIDLADKLLANYPGKVVQKVISEYGIDSENNPAFDNFLSATYTLAAIKNAASSLDWMFLFEAKDGPPPSGNPPFWGRWGLFTHESVGKLAKPRFQTLMTLNKMGGDRLDVTGGGTFVDALASNEAGKIQVLVYNYDLTGSHYETAPLTITNLPKGNYKITRTSVSNNVPFSEVQKVDQGIVKTEVILRPNEIVLLEIERESALLTFTQGRTDESNNLSLELISGNEMPVFALPQTEGEVKGSLGFWFKPYWSGADEIVDYPLFSIVGAGGQVLFAEVKKVGFNNQLVFGLSINGVDQADSEVMVPIRDWLVNKWQNLRFSWGSGKLGIEVSGNLIEKELDQILLPQNELQLGLANGAIDDLILTKDDKTSLQKSFSGNLD